MAEDPDALESLLSALRTDKDGLSEWNMSIIRMVVMISGRLAVVEKSMADKADKREVWWIRFLLFSAISAMGALALALIPGILFRSHGS